MIADFFGNKETIIIATCWWGMKDSEVQKVTHTYIYTQ